MRLRAEAFPQPMGGSAHPGVHAWAAQRACCTKVGHKRLLCILRQTFFCQSDPCYAVQGITDAAESDSRFPFLDSVCCVLSLGSSALHPDDDQDNIVRMALQLPSSAYGKLKISHLGSHKVEAMAGAGLHSHEQAAEGFPPLSPTLLQKFCALLARSYRRHSSCRHAGAGMLPCHQRTLHALSQVVGHLAATSKASDC